MHDQNRGLALAKKLAKRVGVVWAYRSLRAMQVGRKEPLEVWQQGLRSEVEFWERVLPGRVASNAEYKSRTDPRASIRDPLLKMLIAKIHDERITIIDVGAGPLTAVGKSYPGKTVCITATDPLADEYLRIMQEARINAPVPPIPCRGENLLDLFGRERFDIAVATNSLDHCIDPIRVITNMVHLVKEGRFVVLRHLRREAQAHRYQGLHQWNFDIKDGQFVIWRTGKDKIRLDRVLGSTATVACFEEGSSIVCLLTKERPARRSPMVHLQSNVV